MEGRILLTTAITEVGSGSNPRAGTTVAVPVEQAGSRDGDRGGGGDGGGAGWLVTGDKRWIGMNTWAAGLITLCHVRYCRCVVVVVFAC